MKLAIIAMVAVAAAVLIGLVLVLSGVICSLEDWLGADEDE